MHTLYESDSFSVTHMLANGESEDQAPEKTERYPLGVPSLARHGFEIVDKRSN